MEVGQDGGRADQCVVVIWEEGAEGGEGIGQASGDVVGGAFMGEITAPAHGEGVAQESA
jgi:hypothetical protein